MWLRLLRVFNLLGLFACVVVVKAQGTPIPNPLAHEVMLINIQSSSVFWSPDSQYLVASKPVVAGSRDTSYGVYDVVNNKLLYDVPRFVDWLPNSTRIITRESDNSDAQIRVTQTGSIIMTLQGAQIGWKWNTSHTQAASESADNNLHIYDIATGEILQTWRNVLVQNALWNDDGRLIAVYGVDTILRVYDVATGSLKAQLMGYQPIGWSADSRELIITPKQQAFPAKLGIWTLESGTTALFDVLNMNYLWSPDGTQLAFAGTDQSIHFVDVASGRDLQRLSGFDNQVRLYNWDQPDRLVVVTGDYGAGIELAYEVYELQTKTRILKAPFDISSNSYIAGDELIITQLCREVFCTREFDLKTGEQLRQTDYPPTDVSSSVIASPNEFWMINTIYPNVTKTPDQFLNLYNLQTGEMSVLPGYRDFILYNAWSPDSHFFAVISENTVRIWAVEINVG